MIGFIDSLTRPFMRALDPERAHRLAINGLKVMPLPRAGTDDPRLAVQAFGLAFPNPVGLAPGFDKHGEVADSVLRLGFGFVEIGTVTPRPQEGNPRPRVFRLEPDEAVINRLGFNSEGQEAVLGRLSGRGEGGGIVGVNIGANRDSIDRVADYVVLVQTFAPVASYFTVNISSPNTPGLRDLQQARVLDDLLARVLDMRDRAAGRRSVPVLLKIAPDLTLADLDDVVGTARSRRIDGMIVSNTTVMRPPSLRAREQAMEQGGLSGRPLFRLATRMLAETFVRVEGQFPLIGSGGTDSGAAAFAKIKAGASLIQLYSGLVFRGLRLVADIKTDLVNFVRLGRHDSLADAVGLDAAAMTAEPWPE
jgi:dihydroorotate dehydrogenase